MSVEFKASLRRCGDCQLCCKLLPVREGSKVEMRSTLAELVKIGAARPGDYERMVDDFNKPAGERCPHQRHRKGCAIYERRPFGCRYWSCRWLTEDDTADLSRPDRVHYVIDAAEDFVTTSDGEKVPVVQVWLDPHYPDAHRDPALRAYLKRRGGEGRAALIRLDTHKAFLLVPPQMSPDGRFFELHANIANENQHSHKEIMEAVGPSAAPVRIRI